MKTEKKRCVKILIFSISLVIVIVMLLLAEAEPVYRMASGRTEGARVWEEGWYIVTDTGKEFCRLPYETDAGKGQKLILEHEITGEEWNKWFVIHIVNEFYTVYADDTLLFEQETAYSPKYGVVPAGGRHYMQIPEGTKILRMEVSTPYMNSILRYNNIMIGDSEGALVRVYYNVYQYHFVIDVLLIVTGIIGILCGLYLYLLKEQDNLFLKSGFLMVAVGAWLRVGTSNVEFNLLQYPVQRQASYATFLLISIAMCGLTKYYFQDDYRKYRILQFLCLAQMVLYYGLYFMGIFELPEMIPAVHVTWVVLAANILYDNFKLMKAETRVKKYIRLSAIMFVILFGCIELFVYYCRLNSMNKGLWLRLGIILWVVLSAAEYLHDRRRRRIVLLEQQAMQKELQLQVTLSQLQPHFLFNALGAIRIMIYTDAEMAYDMLYDFSGFLRACINNLRNSNMISFSKELKQIKNYLNIEKKRFNERIQVVYEIETEEFDIPPLTVEPLVVNAVYHGLRKGKDGGTVTLRTYREEKYVVVQVIDDGVGFDTKAWEREHPIREQDELSGASYMGLENIRSRLIAQAGAEMLMDSSPETGTVITIRIPARAEERKEETFIDENDYSR